MLVACRLTLDACRLPLVACSLLLVAYIPEKNFVVHCPFRDNELAFNVFHKLCFLFLDSSTPGNPGRRCPALELDSWPRLLQPLMLWAKLPSVESRPCEKKI